MVISYIDLLWLGANVVTDDNYASVSAREDLARELALTGNLDEANRLVNDCFNLVTVWWARENFNPNSIIGYKRNPEFVNQAAKPRLMVARMRQLITDASNRLNELMIKNQHLTNPLGEWN